MNKKTRLIGYSALGCIIIGLVYTGSCILFPSPKFDAVLFKQETQYTDGDLSLFFDIAFKGWGIRKWETDILVEIVNIDKLDTVAIAEVDSLIKLLAPLIQPLKIQWVTEGGNFRIHRRLPGEQMPRYRGTIPKGICHYNSIFKSWSFVSVDVYESSLPYDPPHILLHECLHGLGLIHPSVKYPFHMSIVTYKTPNIFGSIEESEEYNSQKFPLSVQEQQVLKMLYRPTIKSGLSKKRFKEALNIK
ncbi:MAG: hypothetical protein AB2L24_02410 [Mangrovibacterium sp.]